MVVYATRLLGNQDDAEDTVQEVFSKLLSKWDTMQIDNHSHGLLFTMLHNRIMDILRSQNRHHMTSIAEINSELATNSSEESIFEMETYVKLYHEIELLPRKNREVMRMKMKGMDDHDIAEALGLSINTVRNHVKNGVHSLRQKFDYKALLLFFI